MKLLLKNPASSLEDEYLRKRLLKFYQEEYYGEISVQKLEDKHWLVKNKYNVKLTNNGFTCDCPDFKFRRKICKHIFAVLMQEDLPDTALTLLISTPELAKVLKIQK